MKPTSLDGIRALLAQCPVPSGRPGGSRAERKRQLQIRWTGLVITGAVKVREAALALDVDRRTILHWRTTLLADGQPDTDVLRALAERRRRARAKR